MTTPTTQREADEQAELSTYSSKDIAAIFAGKPTLFYAKGDVDALLSQSRAAIDQSTRQAAPEAPAAQEAPAELWFWRSPRGVWEECPAGEEGAMRFIPVLAAQGDARQSAPNVLEALREARQFIKHNTVAQVKVDAAIAALESAPAATDQPSAGQVDERALFEAAARRDPYAIYSFARFGNGQAQGARYYLHTKTEAAWGVWQSARASLTPTAPAEPAGWRLVPIKPDAPMLTALWNRKDVEAPAHLDDAYAAMLAVTPTAPQAASQQAETPTAWIAWYDGVKSQNVARTLAEKAEIENIARLMGYDATLTWEELYSRAPLPAQQVQAVDVARDAARYRFLRKGFGDFGPDVDLHNAFVDGNEKMDAAIDAAMSRTGGSHD